MLFTPKMYESFTSHIFSDIPNWNFTCSFFKSKRNRLKFSLLFSFVWDSNLHPAGKNTVRFVQFYKWIKHLNFYIELDRLICVQPLDSLWRKPKVYIPILKFELLSFLIAVLNKGSSALNCKTSHKCPYSL